MLAFCIFFSSIIYKRHDAPIMLSWIVQISKIHNFCAWIITYCCFLSSIWRKSAYIKTLLYQTGYFFSKSCELIGFDFSRIFSSSWGGAPCVVCRYSLSLSLGLSDRQIKAMSEACWSERERESRERAAPTRPLCGRRREGGRGDCLKILSD